MTPRLDNRSYYDAMARAYERERHRGYHAFLDDAEVRCIEDLARGAEVLEVGCGTGLILERLARVARRVAGADLSAAMLERARERGFSVVQADALCLPFRDHSFDFAVSFKVLAHIPEVRRAVAEIARVVRPGGHLALEFYNRHSLRALIKALKPPSGIAGGVEDTDVFTRYDSLSEACSYLGPRLTPVRFHGVRVLLPAAFLMRVPVASRVFDASERLLSASPLRRFAGFLILVAKVQ